MLKTVNHPYLQFLIALNYYRYTNVFLETVQTAVVRYLFLFLFFGAQHVIHLPGVETAVPLAVLPKLFPHGRLGFGQFFVHLLRVLNKLFTFLFNYFNLLCGFCLIFEKEIHFFLCGKCIIKYVNAQ